MRPRPSHPAIGPYEISNMPGFQLQFRMSHRMQGRSGVGVRGGFGERVGLKGRVHTRRKRASLLAGSPNECSHLARPPSLADKIQLSETVNVRHNRSLVGLLGMIWFIC